MQRTLIRLTVVLLLSFMCVGGPRVPSIQQQPQPTPEYGSLRWRIQQAKLKGEQQLQIASLICYGSEFKNPAEALKEALSYFAVIVAQPIEKKTYADTDSLYTWYRFKVIETLNPRPLSECLGCINPGEAPSDMLPVGESEILILQAGGAMVIDDFYVVDNSSRPYSMEQEYLIFLRLDSTKQTGAITLGPVGVFRIDKEGILESITTESNPLKKYILKHYCNSLDQLRAGIRQQLRSQQ